MSAAGLSFEPGDAEDQPDGEAGAKRADGSSATSCRSIPRSRRRAAGRAGALLPQPNGVKNARACQRICVPEHDRLARRFHPAGCRFQGRRGTPRALVRRPPVRREGWRRPLYHQSTASLRLRAGLGLHRIASGLDLRSRRSSNPKERNRAAAGGLCGHWRPSDRLHSASACAPAAASPTCQGWRLAVGQIRSY
jgi:hypothetical protein